MGPRPRALDIDSFVEAMTREENKFLYTTIGLRKFVLAQSQNIPARSKARRTGKLYTTFSRQANRTPKFSPEKNKAKFPY